VVKANGDKAVQSGHREMTHSERAKSGETNPAEAVGLGGQDDATLLPHEKELLHELIQGLRGVRYGSFVLTVHEGRLVEIEQTVKIRRNRSSQ